MDIDDVGDDPLRMIPPYAMTGGRARPVLDPSRLEMETLVAPTGLGSSGGLTPEQRQIVALCSGLLSIAEIAAHMRIPLAVAKVLVGDLAADGVVSLHRPDRVAARPDPVLLERVLHGLREL